MIDNDYKRKREIRKENFEYLKFNNILNKVENSRI